eukprot:scaffold42709_cov176-Amphora_coffeaeformis.AAC.2
MQISARQCRVGFITPFRHLCEGARKATLPRSCNRALHLPPRFYVRLGSPIIHSHSLYYTILLQPVQTNPSSSQQEE